MKFQIKIRTSSEDEWWEDYDKPNVKSLEAAKEWAEETIKQYNKTLYQGDKSRTVIALAEYYLIIQNFTKGNKMKYFNLKKLFALAIIAYKENSDPGIAMAKFTKDAKEILEQEGITVEDKTEEEL